MPWSFRAVTCSSKEYSYFEHVWTFFLKKRRDYCISHLPLLGPPWFLRTAYFMLGTGCNPCPKQQRRWLTLIKTQNKKRFCSMSGAYGLEEWMLCMYDVKRCLQVLENLSRQITMWTLRIFKQGSVICRRELESDILLVSILAVLLGTDREKYHDQLTMH